MTIERTENEIVLRLPSDLGSYCIDRVTQYLLYAEATKDSIASENEINQIADESKQNWWAKNKKRFIR